MAVSAGAIRAGRAAVEISANDSALRKGLKRAEAKLKAFAGTVGGMGQSLAGVGLAVAGPLAGAARVFSSYEDAMASLRAAANPTADDLARITEAVDRVGRATGRGPAEVAAAMTQLLKAGMSVEGVLGGAAEAALQFARVAEMDAAEVAIVLTDAINVFGVDATTAVNALSKAADASSVSIRNIAESFSQAGAVAAQAGLSIDEAANAIAILGQNGVKGSDAGTSLRTMLLRLQTGVESAGEVMDALGINVRNADGSMKDMRGIIGELQAKLGGLGSEARDFAMLKLFGTDAIRSGTILLKEGVAGWDEFNGKMAESLPISAKFDMLMSTISGSMAKAWAAVQRLAVAVGAELAGGVGGAVGWITTIADAVSNWVGANGRAITTIAKVAAGAVAFAAGLYGLSVAAGVAATAFGVLGAVVGFLTSPIGLVVAGVTAATVAFFTLTESGRAAFEGLKADAMAAFGGIADALKAGDIELAAQILWLSLKVQWQKGVNALNAIWADWGTAALTVIDDFQDKVAATMLALVGGLEKAWNSFAGFMQKTWAKIASYAIGGNANTLQAQLDAIDAATNAANAGVDTRGQGQLDALASGKEIRDEARFAGARESVAAGEAELAGLQAELKAAIDEAKAGALAAASGKDGKAADTSAGSVAGNTSPLAELAEPGIFDATVERSAAKTDVSGSFSAAAIRGLGAGDSLGQDQLDESKEQTGLLKKLNDKARVGRLVFTGP